jgi:hypothetical protein
MYVNTLCSASVTKQAMFVVYMQHHNLRVFLYNANAEYYVNAKRGWIHSCFEFCCFRATTPTKHLFKLHEKFLTVIFAVFLLFNNEELNRMSLSLTDISDKDIKNIETIRKVSLRINCAASSHLSCAAIDFCLFCCLFGP